MAPRSMRRGLGVRAILAGGLLAIFGATIPATSADVPAPVFQASSFDSGWNPSTTRVAAQFDKTLKSVKPCYDNQVPPQVVTGCDWTYAEVFEVGATEPVPAAERNDSQAIDPKGGIVQGASIIWVAKSSLATDGTEYFMRVHLLGAAVGAPDDYTVWNSEPFTVDMGAPGKPTVESPTALMGREIKIGSEDAEVVSGHISIADPRQVPVTEFAGVAREATGPDNDPTATSGLASVELRFYDLLGALAHKQVFEVESVGAIESDWFVSAEDVVAVDRQGNESPALDPGVYVLKVAAYDIAGYVSAPSVPVQFIWTGLPSAEPPQ